MHPRRTNIPCRARDAHAHIFASTGVLAFAHEHAGSAASPAPSHACAARQRACRCSPLSQTLGDAVGHRRHTPPVRPLVASTGQMPHMMDASRRLALPNARASSLRTPPRRAMRGAPPCVRGFMAHPWLSASNFTKVPGASPGARMTF